MDKNIVKANALPAKSAAFASASSGTAARPRLVGFPFGKTHLRAVGRRPSWRYHRFKLVNQQRTALQTLNEVEPT